MSNVVNLIICPGCNKPFHVVNRITDAYTITEHDECETKMVLYRYYHTNPTLKAALPDGELYVISHSLPPEPQPA